MPESEKLSEAVRRLNSERLTVILDQLALHPQPGEAFQEARRHIGRARDLLSHAIPPGTPKQD